MQPHRACGCGCADWYRGVSGCYCDLCAPAAMKSRCYRYIKSLRAAVGALHMSV